MTRIMPKDLNIQQIYSYLKKFVTKSWICSYVPLWVTRHGYIKSPGRKVNLTEEKYNIQIEN